MKKLVLIAMILFGSPQNLFASSLSQASSLTQVSKMGITLKTPVEHLTIRAAHKINETVFFASLIQTKKLYQVRRELSGSSFSKLLIIDRKKYSLGYGNDS